MDILAPLLKASRRRIVFAQHAREHSAGEARANNNKPFPTEEILVHPVGPVRVWYLLSLQPTIGDFERIAGLGAHDCPIGSLNACVDLQEVSKQFSHTK